MADKYGIPEGGDPYPGKVKYLADNKRRLTVREVYEVTKKTWPKGKQELAAAVALAESNGSPFIYNTYKQGHFGLFQISRSAHPDFFAGGSDAWADPIKNSQQAYEIYKRQGWGAWEGFTNKRWEKYKNDVAGAALDDLRGRPLGPGLLGDIQEDGISAVLGGAYDAISDAAETVAEKTNVGLDVLTDAYEALTKPAFWMRVGYGALGLALIAGGLFLVVRNTAISQTVGKIVPKGAGK